MPAEVSGDPGYKLTIDDEIEAQVEKLTNQEVRQKTSLTLLLLYPIPEPMKHLALLYNGRKGSSSHSPPKVPLYYWVWSA